MAYEHPATEQPAKSRTIRDVPTPPERQILKALGEVITLLEAGLPLQALATARTCLKMHAPLLNGLQNDGPPATWPEATYADLSPNEQAAWKLALAKLAALAAHKP